MKRVFICLIVGLILGTSGLSKAEDPVYFADRDSFVAAMSQVTEVTFDEINCPYSDQTVPVAGHYDALGISFSSGVSVLNVVLYGIGRYAYSPPNVLVPTPWYPWGNPINVYFDTPVRGVGVFDTGTAGLGMKVYNGSDVLLGTLIIDDDAYEDDPLHVFGGIVLEGPLISRAEFYQAVGPGAVVIDNLVWGVGISEPRPDLIVTSLTIDKNPIMKPRGADISCTIKNQGDIGAANFRLRVMLSTDAIYDDPGDTYIAGRQITINLGPGATKTEEFNFNSEDYSTGTFYLVAKVDAFESIPESSENNNTKASDDPVTIIPFTPHTVQGYVKYSTGEGFGGVQVNLTGDETQTDVTQANGWYNFDALADGNFTVTAVESGCTFTNNPQPAVVSGADVWLLDMMGTCVQVETISKPGTPTGEINPVENTNYTYTTSGAQSNLGHTVEYQFDWDVSGAHDYSTWSTSTSAGHSWSSTGERQITVTARCQTHTDKTNISDPRTVTVIPDEPPPPTKKRLIIDTDPAVGDSDPDDGTALIYALRSSDLCTVEGITYGFGNFGDQIEDSDGTRGANRMLDYCQLQINKVLEVLTEADVIDTYPPVVRGHDVNDVWDNNDVHLPNSATNFIAEMVKNNPNEITVIALGTLTNIATTMLHYNNDRGGLGPTAFLEDCNSLWIIGGAIADWMIPTGNVYDCDTGFHLYAEYNIWRDRKAAEYVFANAIEGVDGEPKIKLVPLNATMRSLIKFEHINSLPNSRLGKYLKFPLFWWMGLENNADNRQTDDCENWAIAAARTINLASGPGFPPYDTIGMALALEPSIGETGERNPEENKICVDENTGETKIDTILNPLVDRYSVHIFYDYNEPNMVVEILTRWTKWDLPLPFGPQKKFIDCSTADYVIQYLTSLYEGPRNVSLDCPDPPLCTIPDTYYHLPVGVAPYLTDPSAKYRGRMIFDINLPNNASVTEVKLHIYCDKKTDWADNDHRVSFYRCDPDETEPEVIWASASPANAYYSDTHIGTLQAWRTVNLGAEGAGDLQDVAPSGQFAILLAEDGDDHPCAWFDTSKDWKAYLEIDYDITNITDFDDLAGLLNYWLLSCSGPGWCEGYDYDESGKVNFIDFAFFAEHWLQSAAQ